MITVAIKIEVLTAIVIVIVMQVIKFGMVLRIAVPVSLPNKSDFMLNLVFMN